jgi:hypothetical protein
MGKLFLSGNGLYRTGLDTKSAAYALVLKYRKGKECGTKTGRAALVYNMRLVFVPEITQGGQYRVRGCLSQSA